MSLPGAGVGAANETVVTERRTKKLRTKQPVNFILNVCCVLFVVVFCRARKYSDVANSKERLVESGIR